MNTLISLVLLIKIILKGFFLALQCGTVTKGIAKVQLAISMKGSLEKSESLSSIH